MKDTEEFYPLKGFEDYYEVTKSGRLRRKPNSIRRVTKDGRVYFKSKPILDTKGFISKRGYKVVYIHITGVHNKRHGLHRLIAMTFLPNPMNYPMVNHIDGNKLNNHVSNLEWCDSSYNNQHRYDSLGYINKCRKLGQDAVIDIYTNVVRGSRNGKGINKGNSPEYASKYNIRPCTIHEIINDKSYLNITKHLTRRQ